LKGDSVLAENARGMSLYGVFNRDIPLSLAALSPFERGIDENT
jgi:hypothetical protein